MQDILYRNSLLTVLHITCPVFSSKQINSYETVRSINGGFSTGEPWIPVNFLLKFDGNCFSLDSTAEWLLQESKYTTSFLVPRLLYTEKKILDSKGRRTSAPRQLFKYKRKAAPKCRTRRTCAADGKSRRRITITTTTIPSLFFSEEEMYKLLFSHTIHSVETAMQTNSRRVSAVKDPTD